MEFDTFAELQAHFEAEHGGAITDLTALNVNGTPYVLANLKPSWSLAWVIRERLGLFGTKTGCNRGECGTCTLIMNGKAVYSCLILAVEANGAEITTIEGLSDEINFTGMQKAILDTDALQCGYCAPGFIMAGQALLNKNSNPTRDEVRKALSGHMCTCGNQNQYVEAVLSV
jgi:carbon-monoxide dehydrogenase small subunit